MSDAPKPDAGDEAVQWVFRDLVVKHLNTAGDGNYSRRADLFVLIKALEAEYPAQTGRAKALMLGQPA